MHKNVIHERKPFIRLIQKTSENDLHKLQVNNYGYNEGITYLFSKRVNWCQGNGFLSTVHKQMPLNSQWLALSIGAANFLHCWIANSIWLERAESMITKQ